MARPKAPTDHQLDDFGAEARVEQAAMWMLTQPGLRQIVPALQQHFGLSLGEAVAAIRRAEVLRRQAT